MYTAIDVFQAATRTLRFVREEPRNSNRGQAVEAMQAAGGGHPGEPWCMYFVNYVGRSCFAAAWPLLQSGSCRLVYEAARSRGLTFPTTAILPGDLVVLWHAELTPPRFGHVVLITGPKEPLGWPTFEGNTNDGGSRDGWGVFPRHRTFTAQDRAIRWAMALDAPPPA